MMRTQQIKVKKGHKLYQYFDELAFGAKNLYNTTNFYIRQCLTGAKKSSKDITPNEKMILDLVNSTIPKINKHKLELHDKRIKSLKADTKKIKFVSQFDLVGKDNPFLSYDLLDSVFKLNKNIDYTSLPGQVNQQVIRLLIRDWKSFFNANKDYKTNSHKYKARPRVPRYAKKDGKKVVTMSNQICKIKDDKYLRFPKTKLKLNIGKLAKIEGKLKEVKIVPRHNHYIVNIVFEMPKSNIVLIKEPKKVVGIDLGVNNFATITNNVGLRPVIIKGKVLKSTNQYYNKMKAYYYSVLRQGKSQSEGEFSSNRLKRLDDKRNAKINDFIHKTSRTVVDYCVQNKIDTIVVGSNKGWKQNINIGKKNNQSFVTIPFASFIDKLKYKAEEVGIAIVVTEESYTSKASFLDYDEVPSYKEDIKPAFSGRRVKRGLYKTKEGCLINADVNASLNIITKVVPKAFGLRDRGLVDSPFVLSVV